jgi:hypothetical protein
MPAFGNESALSCAHAEAVYFCPACQRHEAVGKAMAAKDAEIVQIKQERLLLINEVRRLRGIAERALELCGCGGAGTLEGSVLATWKVVIPCPCCAGLRAELQGKEGGKS